MKFLSSPFTRTTTACVAPSGRAAAARTAPCLLAAASVGVPGAAGAQQFVVDDAEVAEHRACQLEAWHGERASWILPACSPFSGVEITAGLGFVAPASGGSREAEGVGQVKVAILEGGDGAPLGVAVVAGAGMGPLPQLLPGEFSTLFGYAAATLYLADDRLELHPNLGWFWERGDGNGHRHVFTWGGRADAWVVERAAVIAELFGEDTDRPAWQAGIRLSLIPDRLEIDLSYGDHLTTDERGVGFQAGFAWTPPPLR